MSQEPSTRETSAKLRHKRSKTLYQVTILIIVVYILAGLATYFIYSRSQNRLLEKSEDRLIQMEVESVSANSTFAIDYLIFLGRDKLKGLSTPSLLEAAGEGKLTTGQEYLDGKLANMIDSGFMGLEEAMLILPPSETDPQAVVIAASKGYMLYSREVPGYITEAIADGTPYLWAERGVPELGISGLSLVVVEEADLAGTGLQAGYVAVKPMASDIAAINHFFDEKKSDGSLNIALMTIISIVVMSLLTFVFISYLIRRRITRPIDELSAAADEVMSGDLDVETPVRRGDEFAGLKRAFNTMVKNLGAILSIPSAGEKTEIMGGAGDEDAARGRSLRGKSPKKQAAEGFKPGRSRTLYYITAFLTVMFLASGLASFFVFNHWQNNLINEGMDKTIQKISGYFSNGSDYIRNTLDPVITEKMVEEGMKNLSLEEQFALIMDKKISDYQRFYNYFSKDLVDMGALGMEKVMVVLAGGWIPGGATVVVSDDESLIYEWTVPAYLLRAIEEDVPYLYFEKGIPELGLEGEQIIAIETFQLMGLSQAYIGIKSMHAEIAEMRGFYGQEKHDVYIMLIPVMAGALIALILLTFLAMSFFIRRNITRPVEELSTAAEQVMQGNLDVEIPVREGEELEGLEQAFREMVESLRKLIARSTEED
jgi:methyl-accepting chemotaxis protein